MTTRSTTAAGHPVLRSQPTRRVGPMRAGAIVLADISADNPDDPFATWWMDEDGVTTQGHYHATRAAADADFERRVAHERAVGRA